MTAIARANIDTVTGGDNQIVAAVSGRRIRVVSLALYSSGAAVELFISSADTDGVKLLGGTRRVPLDSTGAAGAPSLVLPYCPDGHFETEPGEPLNLNVLANDESSSSEGESSSDGEAPVTYPDHGGIVGCVTYRIVR